MLHNVDIVDCLIFLESEGITDEEIMERMGCNRSTISRWWDKQKATPRYLAKMQKWRAELLPIQELFVGKRPPREMFFEALEEAVAAGEPRASICFHNMDYKGFYEHGIPVGKSRARYNTFISFYPKPRPTTEYVIDIIRRYHPQQRIREGFKKYE